MAVFFCVAANASTTRLPHMTYKGTHLLSLMTSHAFNDEELVFHGNRVNTMEIDKKQANAGISYLTHVCTVHCLFACITASDGPSASLTIPSNGGPPPMVTSLLEE